MHDMQSTILLIFRRYLGSTEKAEYDEYMQKYGGMCGKVAKSRMIAPGKEHP